MPRTARVVHDGGTYHVLARGNNGQTIFHGDRDYERYLHLTSRYTQMLGICLYHFVLMPNHVHLLVHVSVGVTLSRLMLGLSLAYALFYRKQYRYAGHLWQGRFKSSLIDRDASLLECGRFIELNPVRVGLVRDPAAYAWSSYRAYAQGAADGLITPNPFYEALSATSLERQERYRQFVHEGLRPLQSPISTHHHHGRFGLLVTRGNRGRPKKLDTDPSTMATSPSYEK